MGNRAILDTNLFFEYNFLPKIRVFLGLPMRILHECFAKKSSPRPDVSGRLRLIIFYFIHTKEKVCYNKR